MKFKKSVLRFLIIGLLFPSGLFANKTFHLPLVHSPSNIKVKFSRDNDVEQYLKKQKSSDTLFDAGLYYFYKTVDLDSKKRLSKGKKKRYIKKAIEYLEESNTLTPNDPYTLAVLGSAYGVRIPFSGFPALLKWSKRCQNKLNKAVELAPENPEIRLIRLRSNVHFPYQYYKNLKDEIIEDSNIVLGWVDKFEKTTPKDRRQKSYFSMIKGDVLFLVGNYFYKQAKDNKQAKTYLKKISPDNTYYDHAKHILDEL